ncbi:hypothetical protein MRB53_008850 [Persea americana]|uniref:Uncharacterized protein n=1 Tax=Persea americana TaxID=3435 RepID=A0ACC2LMG3_PERAE|nr:hypothetical protein MRB53_008850 [Persea americana]
MDKTPALIIPPHDQSLGGLVYEASDLFSITFSVPSKSVSSSSRIGYGVSEIKDLLASDDFLALYLSFIKWSHG